MMGTPTFWLFVAILLVLVFGIKIYFEAETSEHPRIHAGGDTGGNPSVPDTEPPDPSADEADNTAWFAIALVKDRGRAYDLLGFLSETGIDARVEEQPRFGDQFAGGAGQQSPFRVLVGEDHIERTVTELRNTKFERYLRDG